MLMVSKSESRDLVTIDGMDVYEFIRRNADPIWLHQNEMWEYLELIENNNLFLLDEKGNGSHYLSSTWMGNMEMHADYMSASQAGDYYQVLFEERVSDLEQDSPEGKYLRIQRQVELPDRSPIYIESHVEDLIGHFRVVEARLNSKCLCLTLNRKPSATIKATFETSLENYTEVKRVLSVMIPNIELREEG